MTDSKIAKIFFEIGIALTLVSMVIGPFDITDWSVACGATAGFLALAGMYFAFQSWNEDDDEPLQVLNLLEPQEQMDAAGKIKVD